MSDGPPERDVKDFKFQELCKLRVSDPIEIRTDRSQWLAASHKFDLVFIGIKDGFKVFKLSDICRMDEENARDRSTHIVEDFPAWAGVSLANPVSHLSLSCDELTLAVVLKECGNLTLCMYDVRQFAVKIDNPLVFARTRLNASPGASLQDITWNPVDPTLLAVCVSDGSVELVKVTDKIQTVGSLPVSSNACCFCWSPKGRQLVVARKDGTMTQFDQELKEKRNWPMPTILDNTCQVVDVTWLSTYVFLAAYLPNTAESSDQPVVILTVSSKEGPTSYVNFDDVCYGSGEDRKHKYFFTYLAKWELVVLSSSNATETTVIAKHFDQTPTSAQWEHWTLEDSGRAELPLTDNQLDSFPVGATVSLASQTPIVLGENKSHPASPVILLLSTDGLLVPYYLMYLHPQAVALTVPQEQLKLADARTSTGATDSNQSAATGSSTTMPGFQLGAQKTASFGTSLGQSSTLPTTGSSFQFVQKTSQPTPTIPGASLLSQSKTSSLPTTGNSFQFVAKPTQTAPAAPGHNLFTPVGSQAANIPSSGSQKSGTSFPFTPPTPGTISSPAATKQPQSSTAVAPSGGQTTKNLFAAPTPGGSAFSSGAAGPSRTTAPSFGFGTEPARTTAPSFGFGTEPARTMAPSFGFGTEPARTTAPSFGFSTEPAKPSAGTAGSVAGFGGTASSQAFSFSKSSATPSDTSSAATSTASTFGGFSFAQTAETPSTFGVAARPGVGGFVGVSQTSQSASTVAPSTTTVRPAQTSTPSLGQTSTPSLGQTSTSSLGQTSSPSLGQTSSVTPLAARGDESKVVELPTPTYPVSRPSHSTPTSSTLTGGIAGVKRDIEGETGQLSPTPPPSMDKTWVNQTVESTFTRSIIEEMHHFEQELKELKSRAGSGVAQVGSREEMQSLRKTTMEMETFCQEVKDTTREQSREVHDQKVLCLDLFAMTEECRVRQERNDDPQYHQLLRSRALDPASSEKLKQLQSQYQVQEQGLMEVELILDQQWEEYQDRKKAVKGRLQAPTSDMIYRTVKSNHNLIQSQKSHLENLQEKLKNLQLYNQSSDWQNTSTFSPNTTRTTDLTSLVNSLGQGTPRPVMTSSVIIVSPEKKAQLRDFLSHRAVPRVKSTKPGNLSMSRIVAAKGLREKLEEVRSRPSPGAPPAGPDTDQTVPLQLVTRPGAGQSQQGRGFVKVSLTGACLSQLGQDTQTDPIRGIQNKSSSFLPAMRGSLPRGEGSDSLASSTNSFGKGVSSEELTSAMLRAKEMMGTTSLGGSLRPDIEDISPAFTPELASDEQEGFTEEDEGGEYDEEEEEDEDETGFGPEYSLDMTAHGMKAQVDNNMSSGTPLSSNLTSATNDKKSGLGKNLFGSSAVSTSTLSSQPTSGSTGGFTFNNEPGKSGLAGKPLFGSGSVTTKPADVTSSSQDNAAVKSEMRGFSFGTKPSAGDKSASSGFSFTMPGSNADTSGASGFKFGAEGGIFSKPSESSKPTGSSFSAFGGGSFGGGGEISSTTATSSTSSETAAAVTAALNNSLLQALTDSSTSVTSASVTASAALGSSLLAALTDASSPAPQEAAAALSSFSFKPGETPSPPSTNTGTSALVVSGSAVTAGSETSESGSTTATTLTVLSQVTSSTESVTPAVGLFGQTTSSAAGSFGQPAKFSGSPPCATTATTATTTSASLFGSSSGALGSTGPSSFGALSTPTTTATGITSTTTASVVKTLFGQPSTTTTASSVFGTTTTASAVTPSGFGTAATTSSTVPTASSIFGGSTVTTTASAFGHPSSTTTTPSLFGGETTSSTTPSVFGGGTTASTNPSVFGGGATTGVFAAQATTTTSTSAFGTSSPATVTSGFGFGNATGSFGQPAFGQPAGFGQASSFGGSGSAGFGTGGSVFGQTASTSASVFGQSTTTTQSSEGGGAFGGGGGLLGGLGGKPSADKANKNVFGGGTFGASNDTQNSTLFGSGGGPSSFGTTSTGVFGSSGGFTASGSGVGSTGFGLSQTPQSPQAGGFGAQPSFGGSPSFGSSTFGGAPAFGSPGGGGFGTTASFPSPVASSTFGSAGPQQAGFASFASGNSPTFGNLAQTGQPSFGGMAQGGGVGGGGGGGGSGGFASNTGFGSPAPSGFGAQPGFGSQQSGFGSSPQFTSYRG